MGGPTVDSEAERIRRGFGKRILRLRDEAGLTKAELARRIGVTAPQLKRYEDGTTTATLTVLVRIANALDVSLDELVLGRAPGPTQALAQRFEAIRGMSRAEQRVVVEVVDALIERSEKRRLEAKAAK